MDYKGYSALITFSEEDGCLIGRVVGIEDGVSFHGDSVTEMRAAFESTVEGYLAFCAKIGKVPEKPASGKLALRMPPALHARLRTEAEVFGKSLNTLIVERLEAGMARAT